ncbi:type II toxin-antitoxin system prevent-host-death family antitoxin [Nocardiopsis changdeensis]|uniref:Antitoxin n=1 Tax=Nocardiopsis changdeensis TaxID=2831969 RepID=A0ABX8BKI6_9ACTN|nr:MULTISPECIES: type II toxin-antitoxin system prevent-host-death family antitoxin [Nocardiopsis]QUX22527.1 type II toxin-antitoxin system prevent-host-death family antitoxin [Nocardiopsis changdeensis]QYX38468.1 type II toxin-antitoxin system prevent-host-death family antitoxin [Nocardiopsis sp. MT53]
MNEVQVETIRQVRDHIADVVDRADRDDSPTVITRRGREVAAVVPIEMLRRYQRLEEQEILRLVRERMADPSPGIPMEQVMAEILEGPE